MKASVRDAVATMALVMVVPGTAGAHHPSGGVGDEFPWFLLSLAVLLLALAVAWLLPALLERKRKADHEQRDPERDKRESGASE